MKNWLIGPAIAATLVLAGCASTQNVLNEAPREVVQSEKSQAEVAFCLANKNNVPALDAPDGAKIIQIKNGYGAVGMIFSVYSNGSGSRTEIRKPIGVSIATHKQCY
jgi:hypothetical protein